MVSHGLCQYSSSYTVVTLISMLVIICCYEFLVSGIGKGPCSELSGLRTFSGSLCSSELACLSSPVGMKLLNLETCLS